MSKDKKKDKCVKKVKSKMIDRLFEHLEGEDREFEYYQLAEEAGIEHTLAKCFINPQVIITNESTKIVN